MATHLLQQARLPLPELSKLNKALSQLLSQVKVLQVTGTLSICDDAGGDSGTLLSYCINFEPILGSPPVIACPADIIVDTDAGACGAVVNYTAVAIDPDGDLDTVVQTIPDPGVLGSGDEFPVGTTMVTFRATDLAGNFAECTFSVIVSDNEDPVVVCNDLTVELGCRW